MGLGGGGVDCLGAGAGVKLVLAKVKLDRCPASRWSDAVGAVSVRQERSVQGFVPEVLLAGHAVAGDVVVVVAAVPRGGKAIMACSTQTIVATAFITSGTGCRWLLPGDNTGLTVRTFREYRKEKAPS